MTGMESKPHIVIAEGWALMRVLGQFGACFAVLIVSLMVSGCVKPLFPKDQPRTQFETYDRMRNRSVPLEEPDVFGNPQPALRARLSQPK